MKTALSLMFILFTVACGNPHLNDAGIPFLNNSPVESDPFRDPEVENPDGGGYLTITTNKPSKNGTLGVRNPNKDELVVRYAFEKGENFRWNGGSFPGANGSCSDALAGEAQCQLDIDFFSSAPGEYKDNLLVTSFQRSRPELTKTRKIPLTGIRLSDALQAPVITGPTGTSAIEVTTSAPSTTVQATQVNPNSEAIVLSYSFAKGSNFRWNGGVFPGSNGSCGLEQAASGSCAFDIEFFSNIPGRYTDELIVTYALKSNPSNARILRVPLTGERLAPPTGEITVAGIGNRPSIDFGTDVVGSPLRKDKVKVENIGAVPLELAVSLHGPARFQITNNCPVVLAENASCIVDVVYDSNEVDFHTGAVKVIAYWVGGSKSSFVSLTGKTVEKPVTPGDLSFGNISGNKLDFGTVDAGTETRKLVEVKNTGEGPVQLTGSLVAGSAFGFSGGKFPGTQGTCGEVILSGSCNIEISFKPMSKGNFSGSVALSQTSGKVLTLGLSGKTVADLPPVCYRIEEKIIRARPGANPTGIIFPYYSSASGTSATLSTLYGSATNDYVPALNRYTVKDAQVYVSYDIPVTPSSEEFLGMEIDLDVTKVIQDNYRDTESLCLSTTGHRLCTGREFTLASWQRLRYPNFWTPQQVPVTTIYEDDFRRGAAGCGSHTCFNLVKAYSLTTLFGLGNTELRGLGGKRIHFIFSDDTRLRSLPSIKIRTKRPIACQ